MTISQSDQKENLGLSFSLMMAELGDAAVSKTFFDPSRDPFATVYATTWRELIDQGWVDELQLCGRTCYRLRGAGWIEGLWRTGQSKVEALRLRTSRFAAVLKGHVKGREHDIVMVLDDLVQESGLPEGWVFNALESGLLSKLWNIRDVSWEERGTLVRIPMNFGIKLLDHTSDIRAQLEEMRGELEAAREELREFTCSYCGAPVVAQGPVQISERDEGYFTRYDCGRVDTDAWGEQPCPSDPQFPKLEEYEFNLTEKPEEIAFKWICIAEPKTRGAQTVRLTVGLGQTEEEARQRVIEEYQRIAKPWRS